MDRVAFDSGAIQRVGPGTADARAPSRQDEAPHLERRHIMGDKGGKKGKDKSQKQLAQKQNQKTKERQNKQQPATS
jgi:hypothetical protein